MMQNKLRKALAMAMAGTAWSVAGSAPAAAASTTMYNLYRANSNGISNGAANPCSPCSNGQSDPVGTPNGAGGMTDGWVWDENPDGIVAATGTGPTTPNPYRPGWIGIGGFATQTLKTPFGYSGGGSLNWALQFTGAGEHSAEISNADAFARYNVSADIDTAQGAWSDQSTAGAGGWRHDLDYGLFRSTVSGPVSLSVTGVSQPANSDYGFTIFKGINTSTNPYAHHGAWNAGTNTQAGAPTGASVPATDAQGFNLTAADIVAYSVGDDPSTAVNEAANIGTISFDAVAGQIYTIALGGYRTGSWGITSDGYRLTASQVPVPVPAAAWLFGSAFAGMGAFGRRRNKAP